MNKKGQRLILGVMFFVMAFIVAVLFTSPLKEMVDIARDSEHLDCDASNVTTGTSLTCVAVDLFLPFFIIAIIGVGATMLTSKFGGE